MSASLSAGLSGCGSDELTPGKVVALDSLYWALELNHHAVTLATSATPPYDTLTLLAVPRTIDGTPLAGLPAARYSSGDPEKVAVTADGVLLGIEPTPAGTVVPVVATLTAGNLRHADTVLVIVRAVEEPPVLASLSIHPTPPDSAKTALSRLGGPTGTCFKLSLWDQTSNDCMILLPVTVLDTHGAPIDSVPVAFRSSNDHLAWVSMPPLDGIPGRIMDGGDIHLHKRNSPPGELTFYASTTVFGITRADTLPFRIGWPLEATITVSREGLLSPPVSRLGVGAIVRWENNMASKTVDIDFTDPSNVAKVNPPQSYMGAPLGMACPLPAFAGFCEAAGNIVLDSATVLPGAGPPGVIITEPTMTYRRFPVPGTYPYYSAALEAGGQIVIMDER